MEFPFLHGFVNYIHQNPHFGGFLTFLIAMTESLPLIGAVIPGSVTMTAIGALIGTGAMPLTATLIWAIAGAICGDFLSYWLGVHYNERLRTMWPFRKYPQWLSVGENFFHKHGGKSVIIGRFFGPVRSAVPLIAGLLHMRVGRFLLAALPSAVLWSIVYIGPGIVVGALSLGLPPATATRFILAVLAIVAFGWIFFVLLHFFFKKLVAGIDYLMAKCWHYLAEHHSTHWIMWLLYDPRLLSAANGGPTASSKLLPLEKPYRQLTLLFSALFCFLLYVLIYLNVHLQVGIALLDQPLFELSRSLRTQLGDQIMVIATMPGESYVMAIAGILILIWLLWRRYFRAAVFWLIIVIFGMVTATLLKSLFYIPRPPGLLSGPINSSFPSGHTLLATTVFGFLAAIIGEYLSVGRRTLVYWAAVLAILMVGLSRLYLGAHWLTDVLGSLFLGLGIVLLIFMLYRRKRRATPPSGIFALVAVISIFLGWAGWGIPNFRTLEYDYTLYWPSVTIDTAGWWQQRTEEIPLFLVSRLGKPREVLNVQWLGSLKNIERTLQQNGWQPHVLRWNLKNTLDRLSSRTNPEHLPVLPTLYQNHAPVLLLTKYDNQHRQINLAIWMSNVTLVDSNEILWLGSVYYYKPHGALTNLSVGPVQQSYQDVIPQLTTTLGNYEWKTMTLAPYQRPGLIQGLSWDGVLLLVRSKK